MADALLRLAAWDEANSGIRFVGGGYHSDLVFCFTCAAMEVLWHRSLLCRGEKSVG